MDLYSQSSHKEASIKFVNENDLRCSEEVNAMVEKVKAMSILLHIFQVMWVKISKRYSEKVKAMAIKSNISKDEHMHMMKIDVSPIS